MGALYLPPGVVSKVDKRRRNFLWTGDGEANGGNCLVSWDRVRCSKDQGGLGIKDLEVQNVCLLLKLLHKLYSGAESSWAIWVRQHICLASLDGDLAGNHWEALRGLLPLYQAITSVSIGNGHTTSFWNDVWDGDESMAERFPALFSHCRSHSLSVRVVAEHGLRQYLVPRLTTIADDELQEVQAIVARTLFTGNADRRSSPFASADGTLVTAGLYKLIKTSRGQQQSTDGAIWKTRAPPRVQFFAWLLMHGRLQCKTNLYRKKIVDNDTCELCDGGPETAEHLLLHCPFSADFWRRLGVQLSPSCTVRDLLRMPQPGHMQLVYYDTFVLLCCWQLWKRRNGAVFRQEDGTMLQFLQKCKLDARAWSCRLPRDDLRESDRWCNLLSLAM